jgi:hypothetical protein
MTIFNLSTKEPIMSFGSDIAAGVANRLALIMLAIFLGGGAVALGVYFGGSWLYENVTVSIK